MAPGPIWTLSRRKNYIDNSGSRSVLRRSRIPIVLFFILFIFSFFLLSLLRLSKVSDSPELRICLRIICNGNVETICESVL